MEEQDIRETEAAVTPSVGSPAQAEAAPQAGVPEGGAAGKAEPDARQRFFERVKERHPDADYSDEMEYYKQGLGYTDQLEKKVGDYEKMNRELNDLLDEEPLLGLVLTEFYEGKSLPYILGKYFDREELFGGEEDESDWTKGAEERAARIADRKKREEQLRGNYEKTGTNFAAFQKEHNMTDEDMEEFENKLVGIMESARDGLISPEFIGLMFKGLAYDADMKIAGEQGRIDGRNEKIEAERRSFAGDGLPDTSSSVGRSGHDTDDAIARLKANMARNDVWAQGGYVEPQNRKR